MSKKFPVYQTSRQYRKNSIRSIKKRGIESLLADVPASFNSTYQPVPVVKQNSRTLAQGIATSPHDLFKLFITPQHCRTITHHTNNKANDHMEREKTTEERDWHDVTGAEIEVFIGILLFMGLDPLKRIENYWSQRPDKSIALPVQEAMALKRFNQIKGFLKINNGREEPPNVGKEPNWWKKLEPLASDIQTASWEYYQPGSNISIDEQLIKFDGCCRHTMEISSKIAGKRFKVYSLCQDNYLLSFLFASKVTKVSQLKTARQLGFDARSKFSDSALLITLFSCARLFLPNNIRFS